MLKKSSTILSMDFYKLAIAGGLAFWAATIAISLLPIAAEYRAAFGKMSWNAQTVWVGSCFVGLILGGCVSYVLLRFYTKLPTKTPIQKAALLSSIALGLAVLLIDAPQSFLFLAPGDVVHYLLIGVMLNIPRFLLLGLVIGYLYNPHAHSLVQGDKK